MEKSTVIHSTFVLERRLKAAPDRVFAAFADTETKGRWFFESPYHELQHHELDFRVGGKESARMKLAAGPVAGKMLTNEIGYEDIEPGRRIVWANRMSLDGKPISIALATLELTPMESGTDLTVTHQGVYFEWEGGPEMLKSGWGTLFNQLATELGE